MDFPQLWHLKYTVSQKNADDKGLKFLALEYPKPRIQGRTKTFGRPYNETVTILTSPETGSRVFGIRGRLEGSHPTIKDS